MSEIAKSLGLGNTLQIEGKTYEITPFGWRMHGLFERWLKNRAWAEVEETKSLVNQTTGKPLVDPITYKERHDAVTAMICSGYFSPGGLGFQQALQTLDGRVQQVYLMLSVKHPEVTPGMVDAWYATQFAVDLENRLAEMEREEKKRQAAQGQTPGSQFPSAPSVPPSSESPGV